MANAIVEKAKERMTHSHQSLAREFGSIRAGRANASLLDRIHVEYYGVETPLNQIASITIPEARVLLVTPFDKSSIKSENKDWKMDIFISAANFKYPTVKTKDLMKIPIQDICADMCTER